MADQIEGRNPILEALRAGREIDKLLVAKGEKQGSVREIIGMAREKRIVIQEVDRRKLDEIAQSGAHQGVIAIVPAQHYVEVEDILMAAKAKGEAPFIIILDELNDPHNLGSLLRTADATGVHGVIIPQRRAVGLTAVVSKASAGAIEYVPVARVVNLARTIDWLKEQGVWVAGADMDGRQHYFEADLKGPLAIVIGGEGHGVGRLIKEKCDFLVQIPMRGKITSLNAAVAGALLMYEVYRQRGVKSGTV